MLQGWVSSEAPPKELRGDSVAMEFAPELGLLYKGLGFRGLGLYTG